MSGKNIKEVWDYRLSTATILIDRRSGTWVVQIWAKNSPDYDPEKPETLAQPLEIFDTEIPWEDGDEYSSENLTVCFEWLLTVRHAYALPNIEALKPAVVRLDKANAALAELERNLTPQERKAWITKAKASEEMKEFFAEIEAARAELRGIK